VLQIVYFHLLLLSLVVAAVLAAHSCQDQRVSGKNIKFLVSYLVNSGWVTRTPLPKAIDVLLTCLHDPSVQSNVSRNSFNVLV
jgi:hypothetical protein